MFLKAFHKYIKNYFKIVIITRKNLVKSLGRIKKGGERLVKKPPYVLPKTSIRFGENVGTFQPKRMDVFLKQ